MQYKITAPVEGYEGAIAGARFINGVAHTGDLRVLEYCRRHGYTVEPFDPAAESQDEGQGDGSGEGNGGSTEPTPTGDPQRPNVNASKGDWVTWAVHKGAQQADAEAATKPELIELYG